MRDLFNIFYYPFYKILNSSINFTNLEFAKLIILFLKYWYNKFKIPNLTPLPNNPPFKKLQPI